MTLLTAFSSSSISLCVCLFVLCACDLRVILTREERDVNAGKVVPHCTGMNILTKLETQHLKKTYSLTFMMERKVAGLKEMSDFSTINVVL